MSKTVAIMMVLVFVVAAFVGGTITYWLKGTGASTNVTIHVDTIRSLADLTTVEYQLSAWAEHQYRSDIGFKRTAVSDYLIIICTGTVRGSVDLSEGKATMECDQGRREIAIHFLRGSVKISDVALLPGEKGLVKKSCREEVPTFGFTKGAQEKEKREIQALAENKIREAALTTGVIEKTKENAQAVLQRFCGTFGYHVTVTFDEKAYDPELKS